MFMVQGHALDVLLAPNYRAGAIYNFWLFLRGITAPMFLTLSGFAFAIVTTRRWDSYLHNSPEMRRRIIRFCTLIFLGYWMHMPVRSPLSIPLMDADAWQRWLQVDVLQCIGFTMLVLQLLVLAARTPRRFAAFAGGLACFVVICAHFTWSAQWGSHLPAFFAAYCNGLSGSLFPLFPWAAYACTGVCLGVWYLQRLSDSSRRLLAIGGTLMIVAGILLEKPTMDFCGTLYFWQTSPSLFILRVGCVCLLLSIVERLSTLPCVPHSLVQAVAQQSPPNLSGPSLHSLRIRLEYWIAPMVGTDPRSVAYAAVDCFAACFHDIVGLGQKQDQVKSQGPDRDKSTISKT